MRPTLLAFALVIGVSFAGVSGSALAEEEGSASTEEKQDTKSKDSGRTMIGMNEQCQELGDKLTLLKPIQETVNSDFKRVKDKKLCTAMSLQCEYFYSLVKSTTKQYKSECDSDIT